jgi:hypothetical protein
MTLEPVNLCSKLLTLKAGEATLLSRPGRGVTGAVADLHAVWWSDYRALTTAKNWRTFLQKARNERMFQVCLSASFSTRPCKPQKGVPPMPKDPTKKPPANVATESHSNIEEEIRRLAYIDDWLRAEAGIIGFAVKTAAG